MLTRIAAQMNRIQMFASATERIWVKELFDALSSPKAGVRSAKELAMVGAQRRSGHKTSRMSTMDVREEEGLMPVGGCNPARVHQDASLPLEVMSDELTIDDGHPLALELQSLRATVAKYQVSTVVLFAS